MTTTPEQEIRKYNAKLNEQHAIVWCNWADSEARTADGFCEFCGAIGHPSQTESLDWAGRKLGQLSKRERAQVVREAAGKLQAELNHPAMIKALIGDVNA